MADSNPLVALFRAHFPDASDADLLALAASLLAGERASFGGQAVAITFGNDAKLDHATVTIGNVTQNIILPIPPDPLQAARIQYAAMPLDRIADRASDQLPAHSHLPLHALPQFVGRTEKLQAVAQALSEGQSASLVPAIATGTMGVGKTSLALEFAHRYGRYFAGGVFWVSCADAASIPINIAECGLAMQLYSQIDDLEQAVRWVRLAWQEPVPRLLIFDNCEDPALVSEYAPTGGGSRVLVTARHQDWSWPIIRIGVLPRAESIALLQQLVRDLPPAEADAIAHFVGDLPLGLRLIGAYLRAYPQHSGTAYLEKARHSQHSLTKRGIRDVNTELPARTDHNLGQVVALAVAELDGDDSVNTLARQFLDDICHLAPGEPIPDDLLQRCLDAAVDPDDGIDALRRLTNLGLLEVREPGWRTLHRLLHALLVPMQASAAGYVRVQGAVTATLSEVNTTGYPFAAPWLLPHAEAMERAGRGADTPQAATLMNNLAVLYESQGR